MYHPSRGGVRGGTDQFSWDTVKTDKHRENYLGHSVMAPVGRWQKGKDLSWYAKERKSEDGKKSADNEKAAVKRAEEEAMMVALGFREPKKEGKTLVKEELAEVLKRNNGDRGEVDVDRVGGLGIQSSRLASVMGSKNKNDTDGVLFESTEVGRRKNDSREVKSSRSKTAKNAEKTSKKHKKDKKHKKKHKKHKKSSISRYSENEEPLRPKHCDEKNHSKKRKFKRADTSSSLSSGSEYDVQKEIAKNSSNKHRPEEIDVNSRDLITKKFPHSSRSWTHSYSSDDFTNEEVHDKRREIKTKHQKSYSDEIKRHNELPKSASHISRKRHDSSGSSDSD